MGVYSTDIILSACMQRLHSFCFMDVLQKEFDNTAQLWNSYVIRRRRGGISGIPEKLYNIPALYGMIYIILA